MRYATRIGFKPGSIVTYNGPVFRDEPPAPLRRMGAWSVERGPLYDNAAWTKKLRLNEGPFRIRH